MNRRSSCSRTFETFCSKSRSSRRKKKKREIKGKQQRKKKYQKSLTLVPRRE